jgi:hypothetical protein
VLNYYLAISDVDVNAFDTPLPLTECRHQANNTRAKFKDILKDVNDNITHYEHEVSAARVERRNLYLAEENSAHALLREIKRRENKHATSRPFKKLGRQIRGHVKPFSLKKNSLARLEVQDTTWIWKQIQGN